MIALASLGLSACSRRDGLNFDCQWVADRIFEADLETEPHVRHLLDDIQTAEELAIRYGDGIAGWRLVDTVGIVSRHGGLKNRDAGRLAHQECIARLFDTIASTHGVTLPEIEGLRRRLLERGLDIQVTGPIALIFAITLGRFTRWLRTRFEPDELSAWVIATVIGSVLLTTIVLAIGAAWAVLIEIVRVGNEHLSYRARTASLQRNFLIMFSVGIVLAWISSAWTAIRTTRRAIDSPG